ncbi:MAG: radical SAM family heme chaperone HemW [Hyphomicrobiaceae bacterium]
MRITQNRASGSEPGFGVYVHWPFCESKCPYCDFNSHVRHHVIDQGEYRVAFAREIAWTAARTPERIVTSIFFGGGTPSLMEPATVASIIDDIARHWTVDPSVEITLEANPSSVEAGRFAGYEAAGVNRVSLGVQALNDMDLKALGRRHNVDEARAAIAIAAKQFERVSIDLIYARTGQTLDRWQAELREALRFPVGHVSLYQLTIEPGTPFHVLYRSGKLVVPGDSLAADLFEATQDICSDAGLPAYEISNHARRGEECRHNLVYWRYGQYAGLGPGAHGRLDLDGSRTTTEVERNPEQWLTRVAEHGNGITATDVLTTSEMADEMLLMGARLTEGIDLARLEATTGFRIAEKTIADLADGGYARQDGTRLHITPTGQKILNELVVRLSSGLEEAESF